MATCKRCGHPLPTVADTAGRLKCGQCGASYGVLRTAPPTREPLFDEDDFFAPPPPPRPRPEEEVPKPPAPDVDPQRLLEHRLRAEQPELPVPTWTFFSGVFSFPFYRDVLGRWAALSAALLLFAVAMSFISGTLGGEDSMMVVLVGIFIKGGIVFFFVIFGYAAKLFWCIVNGTGDGQDAIADWGTANWKDWIFPLLWVGYVLLISLAAGAGVCWLLATASLQPLVVTLWLVFPAFLLATIDNGHPLGVVSGPIARSWKLCPLSWAAFYAVSGLLLLGTYWVGRLFGHFLVAALVVNGPLLAAVVLIYGRLIGRIAWSAGMAGAWDQPEDEDRLSAGR